MDDICQKGDILTEKEGISVAKRSNLGLFSEALAKETLLADGLTNEGIAACQKVRGNDHAYRTVQY